MVVNLAVFPCPVCWLRCALEVTQPSSGFAGFIIVGIESQEGERRREGSLEKADLSAGEGVGENSAFSG